MGKSHGSRRRMGAGPIEVGKEKVAPSPQRRQFLEKPPCGVVGVGQETQLVWRRRLRGSRSHSGLASAESSVLCCYGPRRGDPAPEEIMQRVREDVPCSICLDILDDPVSIECGHKVCRGCLAAHCSPVSSQTYRCPECCHPCSKHRMIPDTRIKNLVEKIGDTPQEGRETER
ncbi:unnamed protein product, partial [Eretmochelys imbricata]